MYNIIYARFVKRCFGEFCKDLYALLQEPLETCTDHIERKEEHQSHDENKDRDRGESSCEDPVDPLGSCALFGLFRLYYRLLAERHDVGKSHICDGCRRV